MNPIKAKNAINPIGCAIAIDQNHSRPEFKEYTSQLSLPEEVTTASRKPCSATAIADTSMQHLMALRIMRRNVPKGDAEFYEGISLKRRHGRAQYGVLPCRAAADETAKPRCESGFPGFRKMMPQQGI